MFVSHMYLYMLVAKKLVLVYMQVHFCKYSTKNYFRQLIGQIFKIRLCLQVMACAYLNGMQLQAILTP